MYGGEKYTTNFEVIFFNNINGENFSKILSEFNQTHGVMKELHRQKPLIVHQLFLHTVYFQIIILKHRCAVYGLRIQIKVRPV